jgi:predicted metal-binding membrane protein
MIARVDDRRPFLVVFAALVALAWLALWLWGRSPFGQNVSHHALPHAGHGSLALRSLLFLAGWSVMTVAMMLPSSLPLVAIFHRLTRGRPDRPLLVVLVVGGYLGVWTLFGLLVLFADVRLREAAHRTPWLEEHAWAIGAAIVLVAGVYQFTPLKHYCLDRCRSPLSFVAEHWRGRRERLRALLLGADHGLFCVGCCWSLMLLMFAVGVGNLGWMLALGAVMAAEKNLPQARWLSAPLGAVLLGWGTLLVALH